MKRTYLIVLHLICGLIMITASAQVPNWEWSKNVTGKYNEMTTCTAVDSLGNVYAAGTFSSKSIVFDLLLLKKSGQFRE